MRHIAAQGLRRFRSASLKSLAAGGGGGGGDAPLFRFRPLSFPNLKRKASNSWSAVQDTFFSTKQVFESHKVVFTVGTSIASVLTAWAGISVSSRPLHLQLLGSAILFSNIFIHLLHPQQSIFFTSSAATSPGYSLRQIHQSNLDKRLKSIEESIHNNYHVEHEEIKKIVSSGSVSTPACVATAATSLIMGYGLGWRGGAWFTNRRFRREQLKMMGQMKPRGWHALRNRYLRFRSRKTAQNASQLHVDGNAVPNATAQM